MSSFAVIRERLLSRQRQFLPIWAEQHRHQQRRRIQQQQQRSACASVCGVCWNKNNNNQYKRIRAVVPLLSDRFFQTYEYRERTRRGTRRAINGIRNTRMSTIDSLYSNNNNNNNINRHISASRCVTADSLRWGHLAVSVRAFHSSAASTTTATVAAKARFAIQTDPSFKVTKISYREDGCTLETTDLPTSELLKSSNMFARDLLTLNLLSDQEKARRGVGGAPLNKLSTVSEINPRGSVIVLSFGIIRAVVDLEKIYLFEAHNPAVKEFANELAETYRKVEIYRKAAGISKNPKKSYNKGDTTDTVSVEPVITAGPFSSAAAEMALVGEPYELIFLEAVFKDTVDAYNRRLRLFEPLVDTFLGRMTEEMYTTFLPSTWFSAMMPLQDSLQLFEIQVKKSLDCLTHLLNDDDDMLALLLTEKSIARETGKGVDFARHEHVELLIGVYARQINNILMEIRYLLRRMDTKQDFVRVTMNAYRNRMMKMNVNISIAALSLGFGTTIAGFFGMNVPNGLEREAAAFASIVGFSGLGAMLIAIGSLNYASARSMKKRASSRLEMTEVVRIALSDMSALDYTIKSLDRHHDASLDKAQFRSALERARQSNEKVTDQEIDLLFEVFDRVKDGQLRREDFEPLYSGNIDANEDDEDDAEFKEPPKTGSRRKRDR